jgi:hypothetical protein
MEQLPFTEQPADGVDRQPLLTVSSAKLRQPPDLSVSTMPLAGIRSTDPMSPSVSSILIVREIIAGVVSVPKLIGPCAGLNVTRAVTAWAVTWMIVCGPFVALLLICSSACCTNEQPALTTKLTLSVACWPGSSTHS